jgi:DNA repair ATPase RecN
LRRAAAALAEARAALGEAADQVECYGRATRFSQREYDEAEERLQALRRLAARHAAAAETAAPWAAAGRVDELAAAAAAAAEQLEAYAEAEGRREAIAAEAAEADTDLRGRALALAAARRAAAARMADAVHASLADLAMGSARFEARLSWSPPRPGVPDLELTAAEAAAGSGGAHGAGVYDLSRGALDVAEFRFAAGPAEPLRPLGAVASGGEAARVMLAVKAAGPAAAAGWPEGEGADPWDGPPPAPGILVLDEVDGGVGARLGGAVGGVLRRIAGADAAAAGRPRAGAAVAPQVLCVTHLPQVAAAAEHHLVVRKALGADGRPVTRFAALESRAERASEVAAMLGLDVAAAEALLAAGGGAGAEAAA